jgi:hypothetical protein
MELECNYHESWTESDNKGPEWINNPIIMCFLYAHLKVETFFSWSICLWCWEYTEFQALCAFKRVLKEESYNHGSLCVCPYCLLGSKSTGSYWAVAECEKVLNLRKRFSSRVCPVAKFYLSSAEVKKWVQSYLHSPIHLHGIELS